jgi:hypothetical protein
VDRSRAGEMVNVHILSFGGQQEMSPAWFPCIQCLTMGSKRNMIAEVSN